MIETTQLLLGAMVPSVHLMLKKRECKVEVMVKLCLSVQPWRVHVVEWLAQALLAGLGSLARRAVLPSGCL